MGLWAGDPVGNQSLSCYQSMSNATQGRLGNTKLYSATDRKMSIIQQIKVKTVKIKLLSTERATHLFYCLDIHHLVHVFTISVCGFFWWLF